MEKLENYENMIKCGRCATVFYLKEGKDVSCPMCHFQKKDIVESKDNKRILKG
jgi:Zn finger protein HypA/HybF involved in hydrogenase expression